MGENLKWANLAERIGADTFDFQDRIAEETRKFACSLWRNFPSAISLNNGLAQSFTRGYMSRLCRDQPLPQTQPATFTGGQCVGVEYDVTTYSYFYNPDSCEFNEKTITQRVLGPVQGVVKIIIQKSYTISSCNGLIDAPIDEVDWGIVCGTPDVFISGSNPDDPSKIASPPLSFAEIIGVTRVDGLPDDCGDAEDKYPFIEPKIPEDFTSNTTINIEDGDDLDLDFFYDNSIESFPMNITINGIRATINFNGINFQFAPSGEDGGGGLLPDGQPNPLPTPQDDLNRRFPRPFVPVPNDENYDTEEFDESAPTEQEIGPELEFVQVNLTSFPKKGKLQSGAGGPDVVFAGWFEFKVGNFNFPRQPIHFQSNIYEKPLGATGYALTFTNGASGTHKIFKTKIEQE